LGLRCWRCGLALFWRADARCMHQKGRGCQRARSGGGCWILCQKPRSANVPRPGAVQKMLGVFRPAKGSVSTTTRTRWGERPTIFDRRWRRDEYARGCVQWGGADTVRGSEHVQLERRLSGGRGVRVKWIITGRRSRRRRALKSQPDPVYRRTHRDRSTRDHSESALPDSTGNRVPCVRPSPSIKP